MKGRGIGHREPISPQDRSQFRDSVISKPGWYFKILDRKKELGIKWALEAGLLSKKSHDVPEAVDTLLKELGNEAYRIIYYDYLVVMKPRHVPTQPTYDSRTIQASVRKRLNFVRNSKYAITSPRMSEDVGVFVSDGLIPIPLHQGLVTCLDAIASSEPLDYHPGANGKVQDLIHPSLYPFMRGKTSTDLNFSPSGYEDGLFHTETTTSPTIVFESSYSWIPTIFQVSNDGNNVEIQSYINGLGPREHYRELYHYIEQVFLFVLPHFQLTLDAEYVQHDSPSVRRWFERSPFRTGDHVSYKEWKQMLAKQKAAKAEGLAIQFAEEARARAETAQERNTTLLFEPTKIRGPFAGESLKVIVKAANYVLKPGEEYAGTWHVEGMPHERIVASAIYYYDADPELIDRGLALRRLRLNTDFPAERFLSHEHFTVYFDRFENESKAANHSPSEEDPVSEDIPRRIEDYPSDWEETTGPGHSTSQLSRNINIGVVTTSFSSGDDQRRPPHNNERRNVTVNTGKIISFPNWVQHRVVNVSNPSTSTRVARRKILCFFLVDDYSFFARDFSAYSGLSYTGLDDHEVLTTSEIPSQMRICNFPTLRWLLSYICEKRTGMSMPPELVEKILKSGDFGITREEAEARRRRVMDDRRIQQMGEERGVRVPYSLCEH